MTKEEFRDIIKNIPTETSRTVINSFNSVSITDLENAIERLGKIPTMNDLLKENQRLKEALEEKSYCRYANKCDELYDCTKEEYNAMCENGIKLCNKYDDLKELLSQREEELNTCMVERNKFLDIIEVAIKQTEFLDRQFRKYVTSIPSKEVLDLLEILNSYKGGNNE